MPPKDTATSDASTATEATPQPIEGAAPDPALQDQVDSLGKQLAQTTGERDQVEQQLSDEKAAHAITVADRDAIAGELAEAKAALAAAEGERSALTAKLDAIANGATVEQVAQGALRKVGPLNNADRRGLDDALAGTAELVFSDGKGEIRGLDPVKVSGPVWKKTASGTVLDKPVTLAGPLPGRAPYVIAGVGLFDEDGDQVGWCEFPDPVQIAPGGQIQLRQSIIF